MNAYPNPFSAKLSVNINVVENEAYLITLYSASGAQLRQIRMAARKGSNIAEFDGQQLQKGMYLITAVNSDGSIKFNQKIIKN